jgi:hypothetical protein
LAGVYPPVLTAADMPTQADDTSAAAPNNMAATAAGRLQLFNPAIRLFLPPHPI